MRLFFKNRKVTLLLDQLVFSGTSFILTILLARMLDMESFGRYSGFVLAIYLLVSGIGSFVTQPFQVMQAKVKNINQYIAFAFWLQIAFVGIVLFIGLGFHLFFSDYFPLTLLGFVAGFLIHDFGRKILLALDRPLQTLILDAGTALLSLFALSLFASQSLNTLGSLLAYLSLAYIASFILLFVFLKPFHLNRKIATHFLFNHWREGKWLFLTAVSQWWSGNLFVVASGVYLGATALGALRLAQSLMGVLNVLLQTFENYVLPQTAKKLNLHISEGLTFVAGISRKAGMLFIPVLLFTFIFAEQLFVLAGGSEYAAYAFALQGMSLLYLLIFLSQPIRLFIRAMLLNDHFFYGYLISLAFALLCAHSLLSTYGLTGAIAGLAISQVLLMAYWTIILQKKKIYLWKSFISF